MRILKVLSIVLIILTTRLVSAQQDIFLWRHAATDIEIKALLSSIQRFNKMQKQWHIVPDFIPEASYTLSIRAAARADMLPCIIQIDQPMVSNFAWSGFIGPLDGLIDDDVLASINTSGKGVYNGRVYSLGALDVSLALFTRKSLIKETDTRYPTMDQPWNKEEFMAFLDAVKATGFYKYPLDMQAQDKTEWIPYAWGSLMISWGADFIDRNDYLTVEGVLNSKKAIQFGQWIQYLVNENYMDAHPKNDDGFISGEVGLQYGGSWDLSSFYSALKEDLAVLPLPDFGHGIVSGGGSWHWAMTETCKYPDAAKALITFLMTPKEQSAISTVLGIFPTNSDAAEFTENYSKQGKWRMLFDFYERFSMLRPETPAYAEISSSYKKAMNDILNGMSPEISLNLAVENIRAAFERHDNYTVSKKN